jgi:hypothetical protein
VLEWLLLQRWTTFTLIGTLPCMSSVRLSAIMNWTEIHLDPYLKSTFWRLGTCCRRKWGASCAVHNWMGNKWLNKSKLPLNLMMVVAGRGVTKQSPRWASWNFGFIIIRKISNPKTPLTGRYDFCVGAAQSTLIGWQGNCGFRSPIHAHHSDMSTVGFSCTLSSCSLSCTDSKHLHSNTPCALLVCCCGGYNSKAWAIRKASNNSHPRVLFPK